MQTNIVQQDLKPPLVLVVDDDPDWRDFVGEVLAPVYRVEGASGGSDAIEAARRGRPALIVLDVMMPGGMDGFSTLCALRKDPVTRDIPVIILSAVNATLGTCFNREELDRYLGVAPSAFLEKPIPPPELLAEVSRLIHISTRQRT